jgi:hypothetical protein
MHEKARNFTTGEDPKYDTGDTKYGPFFDHYHMAAKRMEVAQREEDKKIFDAIHSGQTEKAWKEMYGV